MNHIGRAKMATSTAWASVAAALASETPTKARVSAPCYRGSEDIAVLAVIVPELEFGDIQRQVLAADLMERADHAAFEDRPEPLNRIRVDRTVDVLAVRMADHAMRVFLADLLVSNPFVGHEQANLIGDGHAHELGEFVGSDRGLGYLLLYTSGQMQTDVMFADVIILGALGILLFWLVQVTERRVLPWHISIRHELGI